MEDVLRIKYGEWAVTALSLEGGEDDLSGDDAQDYGP